MVMITPQDLSNGVRIEMNGDVWTVIQFQHVKPGKGGAFVRTKIKSVRTGKVLDKTFKGSEKISRADVEFRRMQFVYKDGEDLVVMDLETYDQVHLNVETIGEQAVYLKEGDELNVIWWKENPISVEIPLKADLKVVETMMGEKGNTVNQALKPATLENGIVVQVPMFIKEGDVIRLDTRDGKYEERV